MLIYLHIHMFICRCLDLYHAHMLMLLLWPLSCLYFHDRMSYLYSFAYLTWHIDLYLGLRYKVHTFWAFKISLFSIQLSNDIWWPTTAGSVWLKWKSGRIEKILISLLFVWLGVKSGEMEKASLYKFTLILLLKNDVQLKQKSGKQSKNIITQIYYKKKNHV